MPDYSLPGNISSSAFETKRKPHWNSGRDSNKLIIDP
jgi:hypothetical protein